MNTGMLKLGLDTIIIFGTHANISKLFRAVGGNATFAQKIASAVAGVTLGCAAAGQVNKIIDIVKEETQKFKEQIEEPDDDEYRKFEKEEEYEKFEEEPEKSTKSEKVNSDDYVNIDDWNFVNDLFKRHELIKYLSFNKKFGFIRFLDIRNNKAYRFRKEVVN